jgi:hypothetical protein
MVTSQDTALVFGLEDAKFTSDEVKEKVKIAQETEAKINLISQNYCNLDMDLDLLKDKLLSWISERKVWTKNVGDEMLGRYGTMVGRGSSFCFHRSHMLYCNSA